MSGHVPKLYAVPKLSGDFALPNFDGTYIGPELDISGCLLSQRATFLPQTLQTWSTLTHRQHPRRHRQRAAKLNYHLVNLSRCGWARLGSGLLTRLCLRRISQPLSWSFWNSAGNRSKRVLRLDTRMAPPCYCHRLPEILCHWFGCWRPLQPLVGMRLDWLDIVTHGSMYLSIFRESTQV